MFVAEGVKVTLCELLPALGRLVGTVQVKFPVELATPPLRTELLNACPKVIGAAEGQLLITGVPLTMTKVAVWLVIPKVFEAVSVAVFVPAVVGIPVIKPLVLFVRPAGRLVARNVIGVVPLAVTMLLKATPTVPLKELVEVKVGGVFVLDPKVALSKILVPATFVKLFVRETLLELDMFNATIN